MAKVSINLLSAQQDPQLLAHSIVVIGQKLSTGSAVAGDLQEGIISKTQVNTLFGRGSHIAKMLNAVLDVVSISRIQPPISAIALADNGTTKADGTFTVTATPTETGTIDFYIDDKKNGKYTISIVKTDTATTIGDKIESAITANLDANYTANNVAGVVTVTAKNAGTNGNQIRLGFEGDVAGVSIAKSGDFLADGATDPSLTGLFDSIIDLPKRAIVYPSVYDEEDLIDFTKNRIATNSDNILLYTQGYTTKVDTFATLQSYLNTSIVNERTFTPFGMLNTTNARFINPDVATATFVAQMALLLTEGANVSTINSGIESTQGGALWSAIPYTNMPMLNFPISTDDFSDEEATILQNLGLSLFKNNKAQTNVIVRDIRTSLRTDSLGNDDNTFKFLNYLQTSVACIEYIVNLLDIRFPRHKLTTGRLIKGQPMVNRNSYIGVLKEAYVTLASDPAYGLLVSSLEAERLFVEILTETTIVDLANGSINSKAILPIVTQLREITIDFQPTFN